MMMTMALLPLIVVEPFRLELFLVCRFLLAVLLDPRHPVCCHVEKTLHSQVNGHYHNPVSDFFD